MLAITTTRHKVFFTISGLFGCGGDDYSAYADQVDNTIDRLLEKCRNDNNTLTNLAYCISRDQAYQILFRELPGITAGNPGLRKHAGQAICRRVLFLLHPDRFGFEKFGWIH